MFLVKVFSAVLAVSSVHALPTFVKSSIFEKISTPPPGWELDETVKLDKDASLMKLRLHLVQQNKDKFYELATNIATPGHDLYLSHLDQHVIDAMIAPKTESRDLVLQWLATAKLDSQATVSARGDSVILEATVSQIEELLQAEYNAYINKGLKEGAVRTLEYSLPDALKGHVDIVQPTTFFGLRAMRSTIKEHTAIDESALFTEGTAAVTGCSGTTITPTCLANLYSFTSAPATLTKGLMGIAGFLEQWPSKSDLTTFMNSYAYFANKAYTYTCTLINGGTCPSSGSGYPGIEANLDVQYARAITSEIPNVYYSTGGSPPIVGGGSNTNEPYLEFLDYLLGLSTSALPQTISISYGDDESTVPLSYADEVCSLFSQLGARGVSVLVASGDSGVGTTCVTTGTTKGFTTSFPASCPWVTVVGGTTGNSPEKAWTDGGGGFSSVFGQPSYQASAVNKWLTTDTTHAGVTNYFNKSGRAYPDVAAQATNFVIVASGSAELVDGTSCATPTFSSVIQLINSNRVAAGKAGLGFLNPWLYTNASSALTDITSGKITGCSGVISGAGFSAVAGWDPATGLGTPNYTKLLAISNST
ncbi:tripeptidyl-peptidase 1 precursor protein [Rutstroemia sp. NJR-2017a BVV2]|nr:tripeptidyl-peptidase 1 precursor protein [Rutstroemia sp. NJR-2017a BVV2]